MGKLSDYEQQKLDEVSHCQFEHTILPLLYMTILGVLQCKHTNTCSCMDRAK